MNFNYLFKTVVFVCAISLFASCDKDYNEIGSEIVGDDNFGFEKYSDASVVLYNQKIGPVATNNLPLNKLGIYNSPVFGKTTASILTQILLPTQSVNFGNNVEVTKVELSIPLFSTLKSTDATTGNSLYELDSIYGAAKIKLDVYESTFYMKDFDPSTGFQEGQKYYSDQAAEFDAAKNPTRLNDDSNTAQNDEFVFSPAEIITYKDVDGVQVVDTRSKPAVQMNLNNAFFQNKIFGQGAAGKLVNNNIFTEYFRGLYFKASPAASAGDNGSMALLNMAGAVVKITYKQDGTSSTDGVLNRDEKTLELKMNGKIANVFTYENNSTYIANTTVNVNNIVGDDRLYLNGGEGSMAVINLFGPDADNDGLADELADMRSKGWLINDATLTFFIDNVTMANTPEPNRVYLYDLKNKRPLADYYNNDVSIDPKFKRKIHGGIIKKESGTGGRGVYYKVRITNHVRNLLKSTSDSLNVPLGLVVTEGIDIIVNSKLKTAISPLIKEVPAASVLNPLGTVLYGNTDNVPEDKKVKLEIYYSKPN